MVDKHNIKRSEYTLEEQQHIVDYIIKTKSYTVLRGVSFWQELEAAKIVNRTWQSAKEHFRKKIVNILHSFTITSKDKQLIREGWDNSRTVTHDKSGKRVKRPRVVRNEFSDEESYKISDASDSESTSSKRKQNKKTNKADTSPKQSIVNNAFSDEEKSPNRNNVHIIDDDYSNNVSPNLLRNDRTQATPTTRSPNNDGDKTPDLDEILAIPSCSGVNLQNTSIAVDSDSDTVVELDTTATTNSSQLSQEYVEFSENDDLQLLRFMKRDHTYLKERNELRVYKLYCELYHKNHPKRSSRQFRNRFINYIFPNIYKYNEFTYAEKCQIYEDADAEIPENLKNLITNGTVNNPSESHVGNEMNRTTIPTKQSQSTQTNFETNVCSHLLNANELNCIYCNIQLNGERHLFVSTINAEHNKEKISTILAKRLNIESKNIHFVEFTANYLLEYMHNFRKAIFNQFGTVITNALAEGSFINVDIQRAISDLEICMQPFSLEEDDSCSESSNVEEINTQQFNPSRNSMPLRQLILNIKTEPQDIEETTLVPNIKEENMSSINMSSINLLEHNYSAPEAPIKVELQNSQDNSQSVHNNERLQIGNGECEEIFSQRLELTPESVDFGDAAKGIVEKYNKSQNTTTSSEIFFTANGYTQDLA